MQIVYDLHRQLGYAGIVANALAGLAALAAWQLARVRGRWLWWVIAGAQGVLLVQVVLGTVLVAADETYREVVPRIHMFYGFLIFVTVGLLYQYRQQMRGRGRRELLYGLGGLFIMGLAIRAVIEVV